MTQNGFIIEARGPKDAEFGRINLITFDPTATRKYLAPNGRWVHCRTTAEAEAQRSVSRWHDSDQFPDHVIRYREV
jgi:hypothetical protein